MKRIYFFRVFQALLVFSLAFTLTNCGNLDNPLEELSGGGGSGGSSTINATAITLDQTLKVIKKGGDALTITATVTPSDATFTWESSDAAVATVSNGVVTPVGVGIATITAKSGDVTATCKIFVGNEVDLSAIGADYTVNNYDILKDIMGHAITIPDGYHVAFAGLTTTKTVTCEGNATIILADGSENEVTVSTDGEAGIQIGGSGTTLTINAETAGTGKLNATGGDFAAGIGTGQSQTGGNITINGGTVDAKGGTMAAGIGTGDTNTGDNTCGAIKINGGTVTARGGYFAAGIGTGMAKPGTKSTCGAITISANVTSVTATKGYSSSNSIGKGYANGGTQTCGTITIGGTIYWDGTAYQNGGDDATTGLPHSPYIYPAP